MVIEYKRGPKEFIKDIDIYVYILKNEFFPKLKFETSNYHNHIFEKMKNLNFMNSDDEHEYIISEIYSIDKIFDDFKKSIIMSCLVFAYHEWEKNSSNILNDNNILKHNKFYYDGFKQKYNNINYDKMDFINSIVNVSKHGRGFSYNSLVSKNIDQVREVMPFYGRTGFWKISNGDDIIEFNEEKLFSFLNDIRDFWLEYEKEYISQS